MTSIADGFLAALESFDGDALGAVLAPDATTWRNVGDRSRTAGEVVATLGVERSLVRSSRLRIRHRADTEDGFVAQVVFEGTTSGGADFAIPLCLVARVSGGRVTHFDEYADETSLKPLRDEFLAHQAATVSSNGEAS